VTKISGLATSLTVESKRRFRAWSRTSGVRPSRTPWQYWPTTTRQRKMDWTPCLSGWQ
jgi:hypothetical protein